MAEPASSQENAPEADRRRFFSRVSSLAMAGGLIAGYGMFGAIAGRFLYPSQPRRLAWVFVGEANKFQVGDTVAFQTPIGQRVTITRRKNDQQADDFLALSTTCPHLGCQVHWEPQNNRFFCPCHNGVFDPTGKATEGPPAAAGQSLPQFPLRLENGLIFVQVPAEVLG
jgi:cytochrome b6-f complex iron-sulfur subunit